VACPPLPVGNDPNALAFHEVEVACGDIKRDVIDPADSACRQQGEVIQHRAHKRVLGLVEVDGDDFVVGGVTHGGGLQGVRDGGLDKGNGRGRLT